MGTWRSPSTPRAFDALVVAVVRNPQKGEPLFGLDEREAMIAESLAHLDSVRIVSMSVLVVEVAVEVGADVIIRGLRAVSDFEIELQMAQMNQHLSGIETLFLPTSSAHSFVASKLIREVVRLWRRRERVRAAPVASRLKELRA